MQDGYAPPKVWMEKRTAQASLLSGNRPTSGARFNLDLPTGNHPLQLYSMGTPNGQKVTIMLEELLALGIKDAEYDAFLINITKGDQFGSGFVGINPNSKIPALVDTSSGSPIKVFESGNILLYLAEKFGALLPESGAARTNVMNWLFWLQGSAPYLGGGFGHFFTFAPEKYEYPIDRFSMEVKRQLDVLDKQLSKHAYIAGQDYSIADIAIWPWYGNLTLGMLYNASEFLDVQSYRNVHRWAELLAERPAVQRGRIVNRLVGESWEKVSERHTTEDINFALGSKP